jgi:hypothetical protein
VQRSEWLDSIETHPASRSSEFSGLHSTTGAYFGLDQLRSVRKLVGTSWLGWTGTLI